MQFIDGKDIYHWNTTMSSIAIKSHKEAKSCIQVSSLWVFRGFENIGKVFTGNDLHFVRSSSILALSCTKGKRRFDLWRIPLGEHPSLNLEQDDDIDHRQHSHRVSDNVVCKEFQYKNPRSTKKTTAGVCVCV